MASKHDGEKFSCDKCGYQSARKQSLNPIQGGPLTEGSAKNYIAALEKYFGYILFGKY